MASARDRRRADAAQAHADLPLFTPVSTMVRDSDPVTSKQAAASILRRLSALQQRVLSAFQVRGPMTAKQAERLPEFADLGFSTVRKRITELHRAGHPADTGRTDAGCTVYEAVA